MMLGYLEGALATYEKKTGSLVESHLPIWYVVWIIG